jgi:two-component system sensor histidine kinase MprB
MILLSATAVAAAVVIASFVVYVVTRNELRGQIDASLRQKLIPGQPQSVQVKAQYVSGTDRAKLEREVARLPPALRQFGVGLVSRSVTRVVPVHGKPGLAGTARGTGNPTAAGRSPASGTSYDSGNSTARSGTRSGAQLAAGLGASPDGNSVLWINGASVGSTHSSGLKPLKPDLSLLAAGPVQFGSIKGGPGDRSTALRIALPTKTLGGATGYAQLVQPNGEVLGSGSPGSGLPVTAATHAVAAGRRASFISDATVAGTHVRVLTERAPLGGVWQVALPLTDVDSTLSRLELVLAIVSIGGIALAAALGLLVSRAALVPVRRLTGAAERVARTQDLGHRIPAGEEDELGRLAASFNTMLAALERSRLAQRQLVSDASHELRTPLTSVRANLDALALGAQLPEEDRARAVAAARAQLSELTVLVGDLVDLSNTEIDAVEVEDVRLDLAAAGAVERARLHAPGCIFTVDAAPCLVRAAPARLDRAIANLLDNAVKWGTHGGPVEVRVCDGRVDVRDHGPGIAVEDLARVFDRFYRAPAARGLPGSGLGLAIVRQVAETHRGRVRAVNDPDGGARLTLELPALAMNASESAPYAPATANAVHQVPQIL